MMVQKLLIVSNLVITFSYFENVLSPMVTAQAVIVNTGNLLLMKRMDISSVYNGLPLNGGEKVSIKIAGNSDD